MCDAELGRRHHDRARWSDGAGGPGAPVLDCRFQKGLCMKHWVFWSPLGLFALFIIVVAFGIIKPSDTTIESRMIGKALPQFTLPAAVADRPGLGTAEFQKGKQRMLNIFASWCVPCAAEAPPLAVLNEAGVAIDSIPLRDTRKDLDRLLASWGNPYSRIRRAVERSVHIALGSSGVQATF